MVVLQLKRLERQLVQTSRDGAYVEHIKGKYVRGVAGVFRACMQLLLINSGFTSKLVAREVK